MQVESFTSEPELVDAFVETAFRVYADDPRWVPPLKASVRAALSPENPVLAHADVRSFVALEDGEPVARATAIVDEHHVHDGEPIGLVGFYESLPGYEAAEAVLSAATSWLRERGRRTVWGPMNFTIYTDYRLMTRGYDRDPFAGEPYNPAYYVDHFERFGFERMARYFSWDLAEPHLRGMLMAARQMVRPELAAEGYRFESLPMERFDEILPDLHALVVEGFRENLGATPIPFEEFAGAFGRMRAFIVPELMPLCYGPDGELIGLAYVLPDIAPLLRKARGDAEALLSAAGSGEVPLSRLVLHTMVMREAHRGKGIVESGLAPLLEKALGAGFCSAIGALAKEGPTIYHKTGAPSREYTLFRLT